MQIVPMKYNPRDEDSVKAVMAKANVVINLIGKMQMAANKVLTSSVVCLLNV